MTRVSTVPSPTPASKMRTAGGFGWILASSRLTRSAMIHFSPHVFTKSRYFWRLSKNRNSFSCPASDPFAANTPVFTDDCSIAHPSVRRFVDTTGLILITVGMRLHEETHRLAIGLGVRLWRKHECILEPD